MGLFDFIKKKPKGDDAEPVKRYLEHLYNIFQVEPSIVRIEQDGDALPEVLVMVYKDVPDEGYITGITYGISFADHPDWKLSRPELCISVKSGNKAWATVAGYVASRLRGDCPFSYGETINFKGKISNDSEMGAFLVFTPYILEEADYSNIDIGTGYPVNIAGLYPIYEEEIDTYYEIGVEKFWFHPNFDKFAINRERITATESL